jgi:hypothetical protein
MEQRKSYRKENISRDARTVVYDYCTLFELLKLSQLSKRDKDIIAKIDYSNKERKTHLIIDQNGISFIRSKVRLTKTP